MESPQGAQEQIPSGSGPVINFEGPCLGPRFSVYSPEEACVWKRRGSNMLFQSGDFSSCVLWLEYSDDCSSF